MLYPKLFGTTLAAKATRRKGVNQVGVGVGYFWLGVGYLVPVTVLSPLGNYMREAVPADGIRTFLAYLFLFFATLKIAITPMFGQAAEATPAAPVAAPGSLGAVFSS